MQIEDGTKRPEQLTKVPRIVSPSEVPTPRIVAPLESPHGPNPGATKDDDWLIDLNDADPQMKKVSPKDAWIQSLIADDEHDAMIESIQEELKVAETKIKMVMESKQAHLQKLKDEALQQAKVMQGPQPPKYPPPPSDRINFMINKVKAEMNEAQVAAMKVYA